MVLICIDNTATMAPQIPSATHFAVNILASSQEEMSRRFAGQLDDRFAGVGYREGASGCALLDEVLAWLECRIVSRIPAGDHVIVLGEVENAEVFEGEPLLYYRSGYARLER